jgi:ribosomal protein L37AE/L43A
MRNVTNCDLCGFTAMARITAGLWGLLPGA